MNIALFHEVLSGGARRGANEFAKALKGKGHRVDLYLVDKSLDESEKKYYNNVFLYTFNSKQWNGGNWKIKIYKDTIELYKLFLLHRQIAKDIESKAYDFAFIHPSQYTQAPFLLQVLHIPKIYYCQEPLRMIYETEMDKTAQLGLLKRLYERTIRKIRKEIDKKNITCADIVLANSTFTQKNIYNAYGIHARVCHMGVDTNRFYPVPIKKDIDILFIGSQDPIDGFDIFENAKKLFKRIYTIEYLLRGKKWLSDDKELNSYYNRAKIVICFGKKEPFGLIPLEAMATGSIVVALDEGGYKDSIQHKKTGFLVSESPTEIAESLVQLLADKHMLKNFSTSAKEDIEKNWTWDKNTQTILDIFSSWQKNH